MGCAVISVLKEIIRDRRFAEGTAWWQRNFATHEKIVQEGEEGNSLYLIEEGELRVSGRVELEGKPQVKPGICDLQPGDLFGELSLFHGHRRSASVVALSPGRLVEIDAEHLNRYLGGNPEIGYRMLRELFETLVRRLDLANQRVEHLFAWGLKAHGIDKHL